MDNFVGDDAFSKRGILRLCYPFKRGIVRNWMDFEKVHHHIFYNELRVTPEEHPILLAETPLSSAFQREEITKILFETFNAAGAYLACAELLSLYASGRETGLVVGSGYELSTVVPVLESHVVTCGVKRMHFGGRDVSRYLCHILKERGYEFITAGEREIARELKEKLGYVSMDSEEEWLRNEAVGDGDVTYELPDGSTMTVASERWRAPEVLFNPSLLKSIPRVVDIPAEQKREPEPQPPPFPEFVDLEFSEPLSPLVVQPSSAENETEELRSPVPLFYSQGKKIFKGTPPERITHPPPKSKCRGQETPPCFSGGIHEGVLSSLSCCDDSLRPRLLGNIVLSGGSTLFPGLEKRLASEIEISYPSLIKGGAEVQVSGPRERKFGTWIGGSIISSLSSFLDRWITKDDYDDAGSSVVHRKCF